MMYVILTSLLIVFLLFAGAFFSMTETAFTSLSRITVRQMQKNREKHSELIAALKADLDELIATVLIGTNFVNTLNSAIVTGFAIKLWGEKYVSAATAVILVLVIVFVEIVPKTYAATNTNAAVKMTAVPVFIIEKIFFVVVKTFRLFTKFIDFSEKKKASIGFR